MGKKKVFLGGTCNKSTWRDKLIPLLKVDYFNPVVEDWTPECQEEEVKQRKNCDVCLYIITPLMTGVYSIAEVVDDSNKRPEKVLFCILENDKQPASGYDIAFTVGQMKSLERVGWMIRENGGVWIEGSIEDVANYINSM